MGVHRSYDDSDSDDDYEKFVQKMNPPRVVVDNESSPNVTIVKVDSANKYGILLEVVQVLIDLNLVITKAYITQDGGWFMDVFNVTDRDGNKLSTETKINEIEDFIRKSLGGDSGYRPSKRRSVDVGTSADCTVIELTGNDRIGLLSEISAVLKDLNCNLVNMQMWTHNTRVASVIYVKDEVTNLPVTDTETRKMIKVRLNKLLKGNNVVREVKTEVLEGGMNNMERRLHKLMSGDEEFDDEIDQMGGQDDLEREKPFVTVNNWNDVDYSVVTIKCKDRPKLLFDTVYTLTDMKYVICHANIEAQGKQAYQELYIRHMDGQRVKDEEIERVIHSLQAAIQRRVPDQGLKLELVSGDRVGLLSLVTRIFREHSLIVSKANVSTRDAKAVSTFYVKHKCGNLVEQNTIEHIRTELHKLVETRNMPDGFALLDRGGQIDQNNNNNNNKSPKGSPIKFLFGGLFKAMSLYNFGFIG